MPQLQQSYSHHQDPSGITNQQSAQPTTGGRWDAILAERQMSFYNSTANNSYQRGNANSFSGNQKNRNGRDNNSGYGGQRDKNYGRRDRGPHKAFHSHVGGQSGDMTGADWNTPLPPNANLER